jgi:hypothetical protein
MSLEGRMRSWKRRGRSGSNTMGRPLPSRREAPSLAAVAFSALLASHSGCDLPPSELATKNLHSQTSFCSFVPFPKESVYCSNRYRISLLSPSEGARPPPAPRELSLFTFFRSRLTFVFSPITNYLNLFLSSFIFSFAHAFFSFIEAYSYIVAVHFFNA